MLKWSRRFFVAAPLAFVSTIAVAVWTENTDVFLSGYFALVIFLQVAWVLRMRSDPVYDYKKIPPDNDVEDTVQGRGSHDA
jgi:hypothetical protein